MTLTDDELSRLIGQADPIHDEQPPAPGSHRYRAILSTASRDPVAMATVRRPRWRVAVAAATAGAIALVAVGVVADRMPWQQSAAAAVRSALAGQGGVEAYAFSSTILDADGDLIALAGHASGDDREVTLIGDPAGSGPTRRMSMTMLDDRVYTSADGRLTVRPRQPGESIFAPSYAAVSQAIVAGIEDADVTLVGEEPIAGGGATRYDVDLSERSLAAFSDPSLGLPPDVDRLSIWIAGDQLRRIRMSTADGGEVDHTFLDIGDDVHIGVPPGDHAADAEPIGFLFDGFLSAVPGE